MAVNKSGFPKNMEVLLPGDALPNEFPLLEPFARKSFRVEDGKLYAIEAGVLIQNPTFRWQGILQSRTKKYTPCEGDPVIGIVSQMNFDNFSLDINTIYDASMKVVDAFEGATKQWRPNLQPGSVVYCMIEQAVSFYDTEVTCKSCDDPKSWNTGETYFGELKGGFVFDVPIALSRSLCGDRSFVLERIGKSIKYEVAIGLNGRVWVKTEKPLHTIIITNILRRLVGLSLLELEALCEESLKQC